MSSSLVKSCACLIVWGLALTGTLSIANLPGHWGHAVCGVWGCGPPLQALVAVHSSWLVVLAPVAVAATRRLSARWVRRSAIIGLAVASASVLAFAAQDYFTWYAQASEWQRVYYFHRVGFSILTTVEIPVFEVAGISAAQLLRTLTRGQRSRESGSEDVRLADTESSNSITAAGRE